MTTKREWIWEWESGGYNTCLAASRADALEHATEIGKPNGSMTVTLVPIASTLRPARGSEDPIKVKYRGIGD